MASSPLAVSFASLEFQNPLLLASGTAAFGREIAGVIDLDSLGGIVTKAVSPSPRRGAAAPRVADFDGDAIGRLAVLVLFEILDLEGEVGGVAGQARP